MLHHSHTASAQSLDSACGHGIRVGVNIVQLGDTCLQQRLDAGAGAANVVAGFEGDEGTAATSRCARSAQGLDFSMVPARRLRGALAQNAALGGIGDHTPHRWVGCGRAGNCTGELDGAAQQRRWVWLHRRGGLAGASGQFAEPIHLCSGILRAKDGGAGHEGIAACSRGGRRVKSSA